jgi:tetratricopeptide (TPR) repeat protein
VPRRPSSHVDSAAAVGRRLREARERAGLSQRALAFDGCTPAYISRIEAGTRIPSLQLLRELGKRLGVSADHLATGGDAPEEADSQLLHAELALRTGDPEQARSLYLEVLDRAPSPAAAAAARAGLGQLAFSGGDHETAIAELQAALTAPELPRRDRVAAADSLGRALAAAARYEEALAVFEYFVSEAKERRDAMETIRFSVLLANLLIDRTSFARAEELLASVLAASREAIDPVTRASLYWSQSRLHSSQNRPDLAAEYARQALETLEVTEHTAFTAKTFVLLAQLENERGDAGEALELFEQALPAIAANGNAYEHGMLLLEKARALAKLDQRPEALSTALGAVALFKGEAPISAGRAYSLAASIFAELGDDARAVELYELALDVLPVHDRHRVDTLTHLAELLEAQGKTGQALALLKQAVQAPARVTEPT